MVVGDAIIGADVFRHQFAGVRDIIGGPSAYCEKELRKAREIAFGELDEEASRLGADAIVAVDRDDVILGTGQRHIDGQCEWNGGRS